MGGCCIGDCCVLDCCVGNCCFMDFCSDSPFRCGDCGDSSSKERQREKERQEEEQKIANLMAKFKDKARKKSDESEKSIAYEFAKAIKDIIKRIDKANEAEFHGEKLRIDTDELRRVSSSLQEEMIGFISGRLDDKLIQTNSEFAAILKEQDKEIQSKRFAEFLDVILDKAREDLCRKITEVIEAQKKLVRGTLNKRLDEIRKMQEDAENDLRRVMAEKEKEGPQLNKMAVKCGYEIAVCDMMEIEIERKISA